MKMNFHRALLFTLIATALTCRAQTTFFSDNFTAGSTIDSASPVPPTANSASYESISAKSWFPTPSITSGDLKFGIASTGGGVDEIQAMFASNPVVLTAPGVDYIQLTIVFTNTSGGLLATGQGYLGIGLYNTEGPSNYPVPGGMNGTEGNGTGTDASGAAQNWLGYMAEVAYQGANQGDLIQIRPQETTATLNNDQDLVTKGSTSESYSGPTQVGSTAPADPSMVLTAGGTFTEVFTISLNGLNSLAITNAVYSGPTASGTPLAQYGAVATNSTYVTGGFNGFALGWYQKTSGQSNIVDISSITVSGQSTIISAPPTILSQPTPILITTNGSGAFSVTAQGFDVTYQWQRNGTNLVDGGNISGATSDTLVISPATVADEVPQADGYNVIVSGAGGYSTNSVTNTLTLIASTNLIWTDNSSEVWDVNNSVNWEDTNGNNTVFNFGDPVIFNDAGFGSDVYLDNTYLSAASLTMDSTNYQYTFASQSTGGFAGPGSLLYIGPAKFTIDNANTYTGGTLISNATADLILQNLAGLGSGPLTLGKAGGQLEMVPAGSASSGIAGNINVADDFTILVDPTNNSFSGVFLGDLSGTANKTLTITNGTANTGGLYRVRAYGNNTVYNANLNLANSAILFAPYSSANNQTYTGVISGPGAFMEKGTITYLNGPNTYSGGTYPAQGAIGLGSSSVGSPVTSGPIGTGPLFLAPDSTTSLTGTGQIFASGGAVTLGNPIEFPTGTNNLTLEIGGSQILNLTGPFTLEGNDQIKTNTITSRNLEVTNTSQTTIYGVISDGGLGYGLNISGSGVLSLDANETYTGPTTVSNATLLINNQVASGSITVATNGTLGGVGTLACPVTIQNGGTLAAGDLTVGNLTINNSVTFGAASTNKVYVSGTANSASLVTANSVTYGGTLIATNISGTLSAGQNFTVFNSATHTGTFTAIAGTPGPGLAWNFNSANGQLSVVTGVATNPTNITFSVSGGNLNLSWPANHLGWLLQVQTNSVAKGLGTNWVTVPNSGNVDSTNFPIVPANGTVFYRLTYP
jgi:autotransporter-associated beta strand protein